MNALKVETMSNSFLDPKDIEEIQSLVFTEFLQCATYKVLGYSSEQDRPGSCAQRAYV